MEMLKKSNVRDYSYAIMFFLVSTFFAFFVIRPVLSIAISIQRQAKDLKQINEVYEKNITKALELQSKLEELRPRKHVLDEALPSQPRVDAVIADIQVAAQQTNVKVSSVDIGSINLKVDPSVKEASQKQGDEIHEFVEASLLVTGPYTDIDKFLRAIVQQRRVKSLHNMEMAIEKGNPEEVMLTLNLELNSYYLSDNKQ